MAVIFCLLRATQRTVITFMTSMYRFSSFCSFRFVVSLISKLVFKENTGLKEWIKMKVVSFSLIYLYSTLRKSLHLTQNTICSPYLASTTNPVRTEAWEWRRNVLKDITIVACISVRLFTQYCKTCERCFLNYCTIYRSSRSEVVLSCHRF